MRPTEMPLRTHRNLGHALDRFQVLGDRCSGTNFVASLIARNFPELGVTEELGWKHGFIDRRLASAPGLLSVVVYRHPVRWMQSVHRNPFQVARSLAVLPFSEFIRAEWRPVWIDEQPDGDVVETPIQGDMYPHTTRRFENICRMRSVKITYQEELANLECQVAFVTYEAVNRRPLAILNALADAFGLHPVSKLKPVPEYKGTRGFRYRPARYPAMDAADLAFVSEALDLEQERRIGYVPSNVDRHDGVPWYDRRRFRGKLRLR